MLGDRVLAEDHSDDDDDGDSYVSDDDDGTMTMRKRIRRRLANFFMRSDRRGPV